LELGTLGTVGLTLPQWWTARVQGDDSASAAPKARAKACIQIYLSGGPGQHETWDMKPEAPSGVRGDFQPIDTSIPGFRICEHLPQMAQRAHQYATLRSVTHTGVNHSTSVYHML